MRILAVSQYYWPEPFNVSDICEELVKRGHEVTVLTGIPNYPEGVVYPGYDARRGVVEEHNGVVVVRTEMAPRKRGPVNRVRNYYSFSHNGSKLARKLGPGYDVVLSFEISPIMSANPAIAYAKTYGAPLLLYVIDIWPECLLAGGVKRGSLIYNYYANVSREIYSSADILAVTSPQFEEYIVKLINEQRPIQYLPQYAEDLFDVLEESDAITDSDLFPGDCLHFMFAGNVGAAQSVQTMVKAAAVLKNEAFMFHVVGSGSALEECKSLASELGASNIVFHGRHPIEEMPAFYAKADAMVATFADSPTIGFTLPRKIQSYMAAGKPIIGTVTGEARRVLEEAGCGFCCKAEDVDGLISCCRKLASLSQDERAILGDKGKAYCAENYSRDSFFSTLTEQLEVAREMKHGI